MSVNPLSESPGTEKAVPTADTDTATASTMPLGWYVVRLLVVAAGMFFGLIAAVFIGLYAGWIEFSC